MSPRSLASDASISEVPERVPERYDALAAVPDAALDDLTQLTAQICGTPVAAIMLVVGDDRQGVWHVYRSVAGLALTSERGRDTACETTLEGEGLYEIEDAYLDPGYAQTGIELGGRIFRFYAGVPLAAPSGINIGTLFVVDAVPRRLDIAQRNALEILGRQTMTRLELERRVQQMERVSRDHRRADSALTVERNFVSAVLDTVGALVAVFDTAGRVVRFNRACEGISGYDSSELVGRYVWDRLIPPADVLRAIREFESIRAGGFPATFENLWATRSGALRRIAWSATALLDAKGRLPSSSPPASM